MGIFRKYYILLFIAITGVSCVIFLFFRFYENDVKALADFSAAYNKFDQAFADYSTAVFASNFTSGSASDDLERKADEAFVELNSKATTRISSLIRNDAEIMGIMLEIGDLSGKEIATLYAYKKTGAENNTDLARFAKELGDLTNNRKTAFARFLELGAIND